MIKILKDNDQLLLKYKSDNVDVTWIDERFSEKENITLGRTFNLGSNSLLNENPDIWSDNYRVFVLGTLDENYFRIKKNILSIKHDLLLSKDMAISTKSFIAYKNISIFNKIDNLIDEPIVIGGDLLGSIPETDFAVLLKNFPTQTELTHYANSRISRVLIDYVGTMSDAQKRLDNYLNKKLEVKTTSRVEFIQEYEPKKFEYIRDELRMMLKDSESYTEKAWQKLIVNFLLLIFPKYLSLLENLHIKDFYSNLAKAKDRYIDLTLVDANGTIDIIEIKKPFDNCLLSTNKYRDNFTPKKELSGSVMQVEKYIFHLNKWGRAGELEILNKRKHELPPDFDIKITNPKAMIILGRDNDFANDQKFDFEIIKRKYANIIDIMTYDDLLRRLDNIIIMLRQNCAKSGTPPPDIHASEE